MSTRVGVCLSSFEAGSGPLLSSGKRLFAPNFSTAMVATTTLEQIAEFLPSEEISTALRRALSVLGRTIPIVDRNSTPIPIVQIADVGGLEIASWCLRGIPGVARSARLFACDLAEMALPPSPPLAVSVALDFARSQIDSDVDGPRLRSYKSALRRERFEHPKSSSLYFAINLVSLACHSEPELAAAGTLKEMLAFLKTTNTTLGLAAVRHLFNQRFGKEDIEARIVIPLPVEVS